MRLIGENLASYVPVFTCYKVISNKNRYKAKENNSFQDSFLPLHVPNPFLDQRSTPKSEALTHITSKMQIHWNPARLRHSLRTAVAKLGFFR